MRKVILLRTAIASVLLVLGMSTAAIAQDSTGGSRAEAEARIKSALEQRKKFEQEATKLRAEAKAKQRLEGEKKRSCQKVETKITGHTGNFNSSAQKQLEAFTAITKRVQDFAARKNLTIADEAALVAEIKAAAAKVVADLAVLKADAGAFKCDGDNPKGTLEAFKSDAALVRSDLKVYREAVRKLIQAVRQANGESKTPAPSPTPAGVN